MIPLISLVSFFFIILLWAVSMAVQHRARSDAFFAPFHFIGGMLVALFFSGFVDSGARVVLLVFAVGVLWEFYECLIGYVSFFHQAYKKITGFNAGRIKLPDSAMDVVLDVAGALIVVVLLRFIA